MPDKDKIGFQKQFETFIHSARRITADVGREVEKMLKEGRDNPLSREEASGLLSNVITALQKGGHRRGDIALVKSLEGDIKSFVEKLVSIGDPRSEDPPVGVRPRQVELIEQQRN